MEGVSECIFCKIVRGEASSDVVGENDGAVAFRDLHPKAPVHFLVVPRVHYASLAVMGVNEAGLLGDLMVFARDIAERQGLTGYKVIVNVGREGGQLIDHVHLHVLGGWGEKPTKIDV